MAEELIGFTVKELFLEIRTELRAVNAHITEKTDRLADRLSKLETEAASTEAVKANSRAVSQLWYGVVASVLGTIGLVITKLIWH